MTKRWQPYILITTMENGSVSYVTYGADQERQARDAYERRIVRMRAVAADPSAIRCQSVTLYQPTAGQTVLTEDAVSPMVNEDVIREEVTP